MQGGGGGGGGGWPAGDRVVVRWAAVEDLEESLFKVKPGEIKVRGRAGRWTGLHVIARMATRPVHALGSAVAHERVLISNSPPQSATLLCESRQGPKYLSAEDRARAAAEAAAEDEARRRAEADDAFDRALKDMMGGTLVRLTDEVADLAASRPAWMNGNPQVGHGSSCR